MISFVYCGNEKRVYVFPSASSKKLADARKDVSSYMGA